jgi:hypothetical protein
MKSLKMLSLVTAATAALLASLGAGSASATVLCSEHKIPCPESKIYAAGTTVSASLEAKGSSIFRETGGTVLNTCTSSNLAGSTSNQGKENEAIKGAISTFDLTGCSNATAVTEAGSFEIGYILVENNTVANLTFKGTKVTITPFGVIDCIYGAGSGTFIGTMTGGKPGLIHVKTTLAKVGGSALCPPDAVWEAPYEINAPFPVYFKDK